MKEIEKNITNKPQDISKLSENETKEESKETLKAEDLLKELDDILQDVFKPREGDFVVKPIEKTEKIEPIKEEIEEEKLIEEPEDIEDSKTDDLEEKSKKEISTKEISKKKISKKKKSKKQNSKKEKLKSPSVDKVVEVDKIDEVDKVDKIDEIQELEIIKDDILDDYISDDEIIKDKPKVKKTKIKEDKVKQSKVKKTKSKQSKDKAKSKSKQPKKIEVLEEILEFDSVENEKSKKKKNKKKSKKSKRKKSKIFSTLILILILILTNICFYGWNQVETFLNYYEQSIPDVVLDEIVFNLNQGDYDNLISHTNFDVNKFESIDDVIKNVMLDISANYEYVKDTSKTNNYYLIRDNIKFGEVSLKNKDLTNEYDLPSYEINNVEIDLNLINEIQITIPHNSTITINGITAQEGDYLIDTNEIFNISNKYIAYEDVITIDGFMTQPDIKVYYNDIELTNETDKYIIKLDDSKYDYISKLALDIAKKYANFTSNDLSLEDIENYFDKSTDTYNKIKTYNGIYYNSHSSYAFEDVLIGEISLLNDNIIKANISFNYAIISWHGRYDYPSDYTIYFDYNNNKVISLGMN